ncbi:hypothetical protein P7K49_036883 [Saguinus oedipus]|uniref:Uncharacterized protein n=1 Tax=Saguinus oedipus TaxID=9490 RepID=A0ABQ9TMD3_SAGOE|nr:hypothetical protein P7K49_036883 [Saguinus oedipus]
MDQPSTPTPLAAQAPSGDVEGQGTAQKRHEIQLAGKLGRHELQEGGGQPTEEPRLPTQLLHAPRNQGPSQTAGYPSDWIFLELKEEVPVATDG